MTAIQFHSGQKMRTAVGAVAAAVTIILGLLNTSEIRAQEPGRAIDAASIRPASFPSDSYFMGWAAQAGDVCNIAARRLAISGNRLNMPKMTLCQLIVMGYNVQGFRIAGAPAWMIKLEQSNYYDVQIKAEGEESLTEDQGRALLRTLVADRFRVTLHHDTKPFPVYVLTVGKNGTKIQETPSEGAPQRSGVAMTTYISVISNYVDRPIVDKTGLTGAHYRFQWDEKELREELKEGLKPVPSVFHAVEEQLGLMLKPANEPTDVLVIDHAEKPSDN
jgi:uncharacterized protein (TIGR03435 family)